MSLKAADHYKVALAKRGLAKKQEEVEEASTLIELLEEEVDDARRGLEEAEERLETGRANLEEKTHEERCANACLQQAIAIAEKKKESVDETAIQYCPETGLPEGEKIQITPEHIECVEKLQKARDSMEEGDLNAARKLEREVSAIMLANSDNGHLPPRALGLTTTSSSTSCQQVSCASFCAPKSQPDKEEMDETFKYAREHPEKTSNRDIEQMLSLIASACAGTHHRDPSIPRNVSTRLLMEIMKHRRELEDSIEEEEEEAARRPEEDEESEDEDEQDSTSFEMDEAAWDAVEAAVRNEVAAIKKKNATELILPREDSAAIARYNPCAHFGFQSEKALSTRAELDDALVCCRLRSRPVVGFQSKDGSSCKRTQLPLEWNTEGLIEGFDVDGDIIATCGDSHYQDIRSSQSFVAYQHVPKLDDKSGAVDWSSVDDVSSLYNCKKNPKQYFIECLADAERKRIWAACGRTGTVHAFTTSSGVSRSKRCIGILEFDAPEQKAQKGWCGSLYNILRCDDCIIGSAGTNRLSFWNAQEAVDEFPGARGEDCDSNSDGSDGDSGRAASKTETSSPERKRPKIEPYKGLRPKVVLVEKHKSFHIGDIQRQSGNAVIVGPTRDSETCALRLFDIAAEAVVGLYCGSQSDASIGKQHCVDKHNLLFSADQSGTGFVWDTRTFQPAFLLHNGDRKENILGVPGANNCVAFTYGKSVESISCWDLRMPASHVYTMSTGNSYVTSLHWHKGTGSLLAATGTHHQLEYGICGTYMYGEPIGFEDEDEICRTGYWPPRAHHEESYFGPHAWHSGDSPLILQYAFKNGQAMGITKK